MNVDQKAARSGLFDDRGSVRIVYWLIAVYVIAFVAAMTYVIRNMDEMGGAETADLGNEVQLLAAEIERLQASVASGEMTEAAAIAELHRFADDIENTHTTQIVMQDRLPAPGVSRPAGRSYLDTGIDGRILSFTAPPQQSNIDRILLAALAMSLIGALVLLSRLVRASRNSKQDRDAERMPRYLVEHIDQGVIRRDATGRITLVNDAACRILGRSREDLMDTLADMAVWVVFDNTGKPLTPGTSPIASASTTQIRDHLVGVYNPSLQRMSWLLCGVTPIHANHTDAPAETFVTFLDITERRNNRELLEETQAIARVGGWALQVETSELSWTQMTRQIHEIPENYKPQLDAAIGFYAPKSQPIIRAAVETAIQTGEGWDLELELITFKGNSVWVRAIGRAEWHDGKVIRVSGTFQDITEKRRAAVALAESERNYRSLTESLPDVIFRLDRQGRYLYINQQVEAILDMKANDLIGKSVSATGFPDHIIQVWEEQFDRVVATGEPVTVDFTLPTQAGERIYECRVIPEKNEEGTVQSLLGMSRNVTDHRHVIDALQKSEEMLRLMAETIDGGMWMIRTDPTHTAYFSSGYERIWGIGIDALQENPAAFLERVHPDDRKTIAERLKRPSETPWDEEFRLVHPDGSTLWIRDRGYPVFDDAGQLAAQAGICEDVTARRQLEQHLRNSEYRFRQAFDSAPAGLGLVKLTGQWMRVNQRLCDVLDMTAENLIGRDVVSHTHPDDVQRLTEALADVASDADRHIDIELRWRRPDDEIRWVAATCSISPDSDLADGPHLIFHALDITERKQSEARQTRLTDELDHRVKNNLVTVLSLAEQTGRTARDIADFQSIFFGRIKALAHTHEALAAVKWRAVVLRDIVQIVVGPHTADADRTLNFNGDERLVLPPAYCGPLTLALHELTTNALKYGALSDPAGRLSLSWETIDGELIIRWQEHGGPTVKPPTRRGAGLMLVRGLVEFELDGKVDVRFESAGLCCEIRLPEERMKQAFAASYAEQGAKDSSSDD